MKKRRRPTSAHNRGEKEKEEDDALISQLPEEILVEIISRLSLREAARTSVLSSRWKNLWIFTTSLKFDDSRKLYSSIERELKNQDMEARRLQYIINWVNKVLELHKGSITEFSIDCEWLTRSGNNFDWPLYGEWGNSHASSFARWIHTAVSKRVQKLEINLGKVEFPQECYTGLKGSSLKSLSLTNVLVDTQILQFLIDNCPLLERLHVSHAKSSPNLLGLKVVGSSIRLKSLEITCDWYSNIGQVEISAPSLLSFKYHGSPWLLNIENVPQLVDVSIGEFLGTRPIKNFIKPIKNYLFQLETLELGLKLLKDDCKQFPLMCELPKLRHLLLKVSASDSVSLVGLTSIIQACPFLHKFTLKHSHCSYSQRKKLHQFPRGVHQHLKVVELTEFVFRPIDVELAFYLLENAVGLEKMIIYPTTYFKRCLDSEDRKKTQGSAMSQASVMLVRQFKEKVPPGVELVIL